MEGPFIKNMQQLIHTEYVLRGKLTLPIIDALRVALYAPTLTGGPIENACRIIAKYEQSSRRYYGAGLVIKKKDSLDSCITIRTAEISTQGKATIRAGATIVIDSHPLHETKETQAKAQGLINVLCGKKNTLSPSLPAIPQSLLEARNHHLSQFLLNKQTAQQSATDKTALLIDQGDDFIHVLSHVLHSLQINTKILTLHELQQESLENSDLIVLGPGPGNPNQMENEIEIVQQLLEKDIALMGICL